MLFRLTLTLLLLSLLGCSLDRSSIGTEVSPSNNGGDPRQDSATPAEDAVAPCIPSAELCDGVDNDCDPTTEDGNDETDLGQPCDGTDSDLCTDGIFACVDGLLTCNDLADEPEFEELCDGLDNDCNPDTTDGFDEPGIGTSCDGPDADECIEGVIQCNSSTSLVSCTDSSTDNEELCNGSDDDCDGQIDEGESCPCDRIEFLSHSYLFCEEHDVRDGTEESQTFCASLGYQLVSINSAEEHDRLFAETQSYGDDEWWIGLSRRGTEWAWADGTAPTTFSNWRPGDPRDDHSCATLDADNDEAERDGGWHSHRNESHNRRFICESR